MPSQEDIRHQLGLLEIHRRNLAQYLKQQGLVGEAFAPPMITNGIRMERENITRIKGILRGWGEQIKDHADDEAPADPKPIATVTTPTTTATTPKPRKPRRRSSEADVYISYNDTDEAWVSETLLPRLEAAGLTTIVDYRDFEIGIARLVNIERAVERSRHTLIVVTPKWLADDWNGFQSLLAASDDPSGMDRKLIPLILQPSDLPRRLAFLEPADLNNPAKREAQIERLVRSLATKNKSARNSNPAKPVNSLNKPALNSPIDTARQQRRAALEDRLAALIADQTAATSQQNRSLNDVETNRLQRTIDHLQKQIDQVEQDLKTLY